MLLAIDTGNTQTALGLFDGNELLHAWRMPTDRAFTKDEIHVRLLGYFRKDGLELSCVDAIAFAGARPSAHARMGGRGRSDWRASYRGRGANLRRNRD